VSPSRVHDYLHLIIGRPARPARTGRLSMVLSAVDTIGRQSSKRSDGSPGSSIAVGFSRSSVLSRRRGRQALGARAPRHRATMAAHDAPRDRRRRRPCASAADAGHESSFPRHHRHVCVAQMDAPADTRDITPNVPRRGSRRVPHTRSRIPPSCWKAAPHQTRTTSWPTIPR
jgi:hypothetical protein